MDHADTGGMSLALATCAALFALTILLVAGGVAERRRPRANVEAA